MKSMTKKMPAQSGETKKGSSAPQYFIEAPVYPASVREDFFAIMKDFGFSKYVEVANNPRYYAWDSFRHKISSKLLFSPEQIWFYISQARQFASQPTVIKTETGEYFRFNKLPRLDFTLHNIDMFAGGRLFNKTDRLSSTKNQTYLNRGLIEEAIASSLSEGAHTS